MKVLRFIFLLLFTTFIADFSLDAMKRDEREEKKEVVLSAGDFDILGDENLVIMILRFLDQKDLFLKVVCVGKKLKQLSYAAPHDFCLFKYSDDLLSRMIARYQVEKFYLNHCDLKNVVVCSQSVRTISFDGCENLADSMVKALCKACPNLEEIAFKFCKGLKNPNIAGSKIKAVDFLVLKKNIQHQVSCDAIENMCLTCPALKIICFELASNSTRERIEKLRKTFSKIRIITQFEDEV